MCEKGNQGLSCDEIRRRVAAYNQSEMRMVPRRSKHRQIKARQEGRQRASGLKFLEVVRPHIDHEALETAEVCAVESLAVFCDGTSPDSFDELVRGKLLPV